MGLFKRFRSKHNLKVKEEQQQQQQQHQHQQQRSAEPYYPSSPGIDYSYKLPPTLIARIFSFVCPHSSDFTFETFEDVDYGDTCFRCDTRDLANCALVKRSWYQPARETLYATILCPYVEQ
jgi:hypothetical protein